MTLSKKYLSTAALALLCAAVFPSCKGDGKKDQPTPPAVEEKSLIASLRAIGLQTGNRCRGITTPLVST